MSSVTCGSATLVACVSSVYQECMYINLILGVVAVAVIWFYVKKLFAKDDGLSQNPAELLESELRRRREKERETARAFERLKDAGTRRLTQVAEALEELRAAMPETAAKRLSWRHEGDALTITMHGPDGAARTLDVLWKIPELDLAAAANHADSMPGEFVLRPAGEGREERMETLDACMRHITSFIVDLME